MELTFDDLLDLVKATQPYYKRGRISDIASDRIQEYYIFPVFMKKQVKQQSGTSIKFTCNTSYPNSVTPFGPYGTVTYDAHQSLIEGTIPFRAFHNYAMWSLMEMDANSASPERIQDLLKNKLSNRDMAFIKYMENGGWSKPASSTDTESIHGIPMFIVKHSSTGFYGGDPAGFTSGYADIATASYSGWKNYTFTFTNVDETDFLPKLRTMARKTNFVSPLPGSTDFNDHSASYKAYYTTEDMFSALQTAIENRNENLGKDLDFVGANIVFQGKPIYWVPQLDANVTAGTEAYAKPFYQINWDTVKLYSGPGHFMKDGTPHGLDNRPDTVVVDQLTSINFACDDRRYNGVAYYTA